MYNCNELPNSRNTRYKPMKRMFNQKAIFFMLIFLTVCLIGWTGNKLPSTFGYYSKIKLKRNVIKMWSNITHSNHTIEYIAREKLALNIIDHIPVDRDVPDTRPESCRGKVYSLERNLKTSVIIAFHNEGRSALLRTLTSILNRSPPDLLEEIIVIDDYSTVDIEQEFLSNYHPKIKTFRNEKREGLIRTRNIGAELASGDCLVFVDSHCEVNVGWLEPLLDRVEAFSGSIVSPILDVIDTKNFQYRSGSTRLKGGFDWSLQFKWIPLLEEELESRHYQESLTYRSPAIGGGIFLIKRKWFVELGGFDNHLEIYGGESLELSLKSWMCGGQIEISVCSRVGHQFRRKHSFDFPNGIRDTILRNTKRIAESWLEDYKQFYYSSRPKAQLIEIETTSKAKAFQIKQTLQCRSLRWYLQNVFQELKIPNDQHLAFGELKHGLKCLEVNGLKRVKLKHCPGDLLGTKWYFHQSGNLSTQEGDCLTYIDGKLKMTHCDSSSNQIWLRKRRNLIQVQTGRCLDYLNNSSIVLSTCHRGTQSQLWNFSVEIEELTN